MFDTRPLSVSPHASYVSCFSPSYCMCLVKTTYVFGFSCHTWKCMYVSTSYNYIYTKSLTKPCLSTTWFVMADLFFSGSVKCCHATTTVSNAEFLPGIGIIRQNSSVLLSRTGE